MSIERQLEHGLTELAYLHMEKAKRNPGVVVKAPLLPESPPPEEKDWVPSGTHPGYRSQVLNNRFILPLEVHNDLDGPSDISAILRQTDGRGMNVVWDYFNHYYALEVAGFDVEDIHRVYLAFMHQWLPSASFDREAMPTSSSIYMFSCPLPVVFQIAQAYTQQLSLSLDDVGGDDTFYDYYPDLWAIADQLIPALANSFPQEGRSTKLFDAIDWARQDVVNRRYYNDIEVINGTEENLQIRDTMIRRQLLIPVSNEFGYNETFTYSDKGLDWLTHNQFADLLGKGR